MTSKLRVGVIGCGGMCRNHVQGYVNSGRYEVIALSDLNAQAMDGFDDAFGLSTHHYSDARDMLAREELDVVSVGVWHSGHASWTVAAAAHQPKAILCEKPMADSLQHAQQMLVACRRNHVKLAIGHQRRFLPAYTLAKQMIADGAVGQVQLIQSFGADGLPNYCTHQTDMFRYLLSDDECEWAMGNVERKTDRWERNTRIEDSAIAVYQFRGGARALILCDVAGVVYQGAWIYGSEGMINLTTEDLQLLNRDTGGRWKTYCPDGKFFTVAEQGRRFEWIEGGAGQADELADWIEGKVETHRGCGENGYKALEMIHAVYESARCHEKVMLPMKTLVSPLELMIDSGQLPVERPGKYEIRSFLLRGERLWADDERPSVATSGGEATP